MYTQCPHCQTTFRIAEAHLKAAKGMVRCGSCQEIFDATAHLSSGAPDEEGTLTDKPSAARPAVPPAPKPRPVAPEPEEEPFRFDDPAEHDHIDLSVPVSRESMPDQSPFMESIYDENSAYNNLDEIGEIKIPGELSFGDSFIKFAEPGHNEAESVNQSKADSEPKPETIPARKPNPYEDLEDKEIPATTNERDGIDDLYKFADQQMHDDEQLEQHIEELLAFTSNLDDKPATQPDDQIHIDTTGHKDFDSNIEEIDIHIEPRAPEPKIDKPESSTTNKQAKFDITDDEFDQDFDIEISEPANELQLENEAESDAITTPDAKKQSKAADTATTTDELPSAEFEIPKALRSSFERLDTPMRPIGLTMAMILLLVVLGIGFLFQLIFFRSYQLANQIPALAPVLTSICEKLPCRYSGSIDVSQIELMNRNVRSHPTQKNALLISAAFINNATFDQPYPTIAVKLSDLSGHVVATRHFKPEEYLESLYSKFLLMEAGTPIHITLAVLDPGDDAINFEFSFLQ